MKLLASLLGTAKDCNNLNLDEVMMQFKDIQTIFKKTKKKKKKPGICQHDEKLILDAVYALQKNYLLNSIFVAYN